MECLSCSLFDIEAAQYASMSPSSSAASSSSQPLQTLTSSWSTPMKSGGFLP